jgi:hypothetical protein
MTRPRQDGFSLLTATGLVGLAGWGVALGTVPELSGMPDPWGAAPLAVLGLAAWARQRRERRIAARLRDLRISIRLPVAPAGLRDEELIFRPAGRGCWRARRAGWQAELRQVAAMPLGWQISLTRLDCADPALPLAAAGSLDALLRLSRGLLSRMDQPGLRELLDCDLAFPLQGLVAGEAGITALAEGGYALREPEGCRAIAPEQAEALLLRGSTVPAN